MINGLANINVELTSRCNKACWICPRRDRDKLVGDQDYGDMKMDLVEKLSKQIPSGISVQLHNNGEPLLYPYFESALYFFQKHVTNIVTNGKLLVEKKNAICGNGFYKGLDTLSVSVFEDDPEQEEQFEILKEFLVWKGDRKPFVTARLIGKVNALKYRALGLLIIRRTLHSTKGSISYKRTPVIPEVGYCWDMATRLAVDRYGDVSPCVRYDPDRELVLGNINDSTLDEIWNCKKRKDMIEMHISGKRNEIPYCGNKCEYWGVPTGS